MNNTQSRQFESQAKRQKRIIELVQRDGHVRVPDLSKLLDVAEITIRRDLVMLENKSLVERTHGGAIAIRRIHEEEKYTSRSDLELENKDIIAKFAADLIDEGDTVFINGGSTTFHVFRYINKRNVKVVTTNAGCISQINERQGIELVLAGGLYTPKSNTFSGGFTNDILNQVNATKAILGVHGISCHYGLTTPRQHAAESTKIMIERTRGDIIVIADHRKIGLVSDYVTAKVNKITTLITDWFPDIDYIKDFEELGINVIQTRPRQEPRKDRY